MMFIVLLVMEKMEKVLKTKVLQMVIYIHHFGGKIATIKALECILVSAPGSGARPGCPGSWVFLTRFLVQGREEFHPSLMVEGLADDHRAHFALMRHSGHRSIEFIALPDRLDKHYPSEAIIRVVLNNHRAHASKEAMAYLATRAGPFE